MDIVEVSNFFNEYFVSHTVRGYRLAVIKSALGKCFHAAAKRIISVHEPVGCCEFNSTHIVTNDSALHV